MIEFLPFLGMLALLVGLGGAVLLLIRRTKALGAVLVLFALGIGGVSQLGQSYVANTHARGLGFDSATELAEAQRRNISDPVKWKKVSQAEEADRKMREETEIRHDDRREKEAREARENPKIITLETARDARHVAVIRQGMAQIQERLRDPASADFKGVYLVNGKNSPKVVCGMVNGRNELGGYSGFENFITNGRDISILASDFQSQAEFLATWNSLCR